MYIGVDYSLERKLHVIGGHFTETVIENLAAFQAKRVVGVIDGLKVLSRIKFCVPGTVSLGFQEILKNRPLDEGITTGQ